MHEDNQAQRSFKKSPEETKVMKMHQKVRPARPLLFSNLALLGVLSMLPEPEVAIDERFASGCCQPLFKAETIP